MGKAYGRYIWRDKPKTLEVQIKKYIGDDDKRPPILKTELEQVSKDMENRKSTGI